MGIHLWPRIGALLGLVALLGVTGCGNRQKEAPARSYSQIEHQRMDLQPLTDRSRAAMGEALHDEPEGQLSQRISMSKPAYKRDEPVFVTLLWLNNTDTPIRIARPLLLGANFEILLFLNEEVRVLANARPDPPQSPLRLADFVVIPPYGEHSQVIDLKDLPRFGLSRGQRVTWRYDLTRPGKYRLRISSRSIPYQLYPEELRGDPTARKWEGSTLSNVVDFTVRRR